MRITGTVTYLDFEGGFWGITTDDGQKYRPVDELPESVRTDGCRISAEVDPVQAVSFAMWGRSVRVLDVARL